MNSATHQAITDAWVDADKRRKSLLQSDPTPSQKLEADILQLTQQHLNSCYLSTGDMARGFASSAVRVANKSDFRLLVAHIEAVALLVNAEG